MVGGLVEQQHIRLLEKRATQRDSPSFSARQFADVCIGRWQTKRVHRDLYFAIDVPGIDRIDLFLHFRLAVEQLRHLVVRHRLGEFVRDLLESLEQIAHGLYGEIDVFLYVLRRVKLRFLRQKADARALMRPRFALKIVIYAGHDLEQRRFPSTVGAEHPDLRTGVKGQPDPTKDLPRRRDDLPQVFHYINKLWRHADNLKRQPNSSQSAVCSLLTVRSQFVVRNQFAARNAVGPQSAALI